MPDPTRKIAFVVEGQTELQFVRELLVSCAAENQLHIKSVVASGGRGGPRTLVEVTAESDRGQPYFALIYCSATDSRVASDVLDNYEGWRRKGFVGIVSLRDLYPLLAADAPRVRRQMTFGQKTKPIRIVNVLSIAEVEAWFLAETTHYARIHSGLSAQSAAATLSFDAAVEDVEARLHPSQDLHDVYATVGLAYSKRRNAIARTVAAIDFHELALTVAPRVPALNLLVETVLRFLGGASWNEDVSDGATPAPAAE